MQPTAKSVKRSALFFFLLFWLSRVFFFKLGSYSSYYSVFPRFQVAEEASKNLASLKEILSGTGDKEPQTEAVAQLAQELYNTNLLIALIANLQRIDFEVGGNYYFCSDFMRVKKKALICQRERVCLT